MLRGIAFASLLFASYFFGPEIYADNEIMPYVYELNNKTNVRVTNVTIQNGEYFIDFIIDACYHERLDNYGFFNRTMNHSFRRMVFCQDYRSKNNRNAFVSMYRTGESYDGCIHNCTQRVRFY